MMTAKSYKHKIADPFTDKLKSLVKSLLARCLEGWDNYYRLNMVNAGLSRENGRLEKINEKLTSDNEFLRGENRDYKLLRKAFGSKQIDNLIKEAKEVKQDRKHHTNFAVNRNER